MILDLHTHTDRYSACSMISLEELILAEQEYVDGIVVTDHDHLMKAEVAEKLSSKYGYMILPGIEISAKGIYAHILAFGIKREIRPDLGVKETIAKIHEQNGVAVVAHPLRYVNQLDKNEWKDLDAIETLTPNCSMEQNMRARETALEWGLPQIGSSDVHRSTVIGTYATQFNEAVTELDQLNRAILHNEVKPVVLGKARR
jgi:predicted metal-dependent phosphoesterase TrpH